MYVALPLIVAVIAAPAAVALGAARPAWLSRGAAAAALAMLGAALASWAVAPDGAVDVAWAPTWGLRLALAFDGVALVFTLLAAGIAFLAVWYTGRYREVEEESPRQRIRFYAWMLMFLASMVGLSMARDLLLLFVFLDLTTVASYFLIGHDRHDPEARSSALMALVVTGVTSVLFLVGALLAGIPGGTFLIDELARAGVSGTGVAVGVVLMLVAALAKSAQVPFHFWLPRAMVAPTPVSAFLHSAAMVAAGVLVVMRLHPLVHAVEGLSRVLVAVAVVSLFTGGVGALVAEGMKRLLAYSTVAQYGFIFLLLALGGAAGAVAAAYYLVTHALAKSGLFFTAGAVTQATGEEELSRLGGMGRSFPLLAVAAGLAAAGLGGLPLTMGFFKDELLFTAALEHAPWTAVVVAIGASLTIAYLWRFWHGVFLGPAPRSVGRIPASLWAPVAVAAVLLLGGGLVAWPFERLAEHAGGATVDAAATVEVAYHLDARAENLMALGVYALGAVVAAASVRWRPPVPRMSEVARRYGPERWYRTGMAGLDRASTLLFQLELRDLRDRTAAILFPTGLLAAVALAVTLGQQRYSVGGIVVGDLPLLAVLVITAAIAVSAAFPRNHLALVLQLGAVGYAMAGAFALLGAPDVALVAVLVGTVLTVLWTAALARLPEESPQAAERPRARRLRPLVGLVAGGFAFVVVWSTLSHPADGGVGAVQLALSPEAHSRDAVTAILTDFRALDTVGETTVLAVAVLGGATLLQRRARRR